VSEDLSPDERRVADEIASLITHPDPATEEAIMRAVMGAIPVASRPRKLRQWRPLALAAAVLALLAVGLGAVAASGNAIPTTPAYQLRLATEDMRLAIAGQKDRDLLRIRFALDRFGQARAIAPNNPAAAQRLFEDGHRYLMDAAADVSSLSHDDQSQLQVQLQRAEVEATATQTRLAQFQSSSPNPTTQPGQTSQPGQTAPPGPTGQSGQTGQPTPTFQPGQTSQTTATPQPGQASDAGQTPQPGQPAQSGQPSQSSQPAPSSQPSQSSQPSPPAPAPQPTQTSPPGESTPPGQSNKPGSAGATKLVHPAKPKQPDK
jgi:hypothetical protein